MCIDKRPCIFIVFCSFRINRIKNKSALLISLPVIEAVTFDKSKTTGLVNSISLLSRLK